MLKDSRFDSVTARCCTITISDDHSSIVAILLCNPVSTTAFRGHEKDAAIREQLRGQFGVARYQVAVRRLRPMAARIGRDAQAPLSTTRTVLIGIWVHLVLSPPEAVQPVEPLEINERPD